MARRSDGEEIGRRDAGGDQGKRFGGEPLAWLAAHAGEPDAAGQPRVAVTLRRILPPRTRAYPVHLPCRFQVLGGLLKAHNSSPSSASRLSFCQAIRMRRAAIGDNCR
jgi:hypothetical protein